MDFLYLTGNPESDNYFIKNNLLFAYDLSILDHINIDDIDDGLGDIIDLKLLQQATSNIMTIYTDIGFILITNDGISGLKLIYSSIADIDINLEILDFLPLNIKIPDIDYLPDFDLNCIQHLNNKKFINPSVFYKEYNFIPSIKKYITYLTYTDLYNKIPNNFNIRFDLKYLTTSQNDIIEFKHGSEIIFTTVNIKNSNNTQIISAPCF